MALHRGQHLDQHPRTRILLSDPRKIIGPGHRRDHPIVAGELPRDVATRLPRVQDHDVARKLLPDL